MVSHRAEDRRTGSSSWPQTGQDERDESADRRLRGQAAGRAEGVEAVDGQLVWCDAAADMAASGCVSEQVADEVVELSLWFRHVLVAV